MYSRDVGRENNVSFVRTSVVFSPYELGAYIEELVSQFQKSGFVRVLIIKAQYSFV